MSEAKPPSLEYHSPAKEWDVFLSHASEDKPYVRAVAAALVKRGLTTMLDEREFVAGRSLRAQIDGGILDSHLGVLFVTPHFLKKRWTREEFDAFFVLEENGRTKIMPIWLGVDAKTVASFSPILAARLAIHGNDDPEVTAAEIFKHIEAIFTSEGSWGQLVRVDALCLPWIDRPRFFRRSLKILDDFMPYFWVPKRPESELPGFSEAKPLMVRDAILEAIQYDGRLVLITGRQTMVQAYERHDDKLGQWVFQLRTNDPSYRSCTIYVRCAGPTDTESNWPAAPPDYLTTVAGYIIASGAMTLSNGSINNAIYVVAAKVYNLPSLA